jgi:hypothetical protein
VDGKKKQNDGLTVGPSYAQIILNEQYLGTESPPEGGEAKRGERRIPRSPTAPVRGVPSLCGDDLEVAPPAYLACNNGIFAKRTHFRARSEGLRQDQSGQGESRQIKANQGKSRRLKVNFSKRKPLKCRFMRTAYGSTESSRTLFYAPQSLPTEHR